MMILDFLRNRFAREAFHPSIISIVTSPVYIIRSGLYSGIRQLSPLITGNVLDFGCGSKPYETLFRNATSYTGVDINQSGHDHINSRIDVFYDGKKLPFVDNHFDAVVSFEVLEHIFNINEVLAEINRVMKPGGLILITIPFAWEEHEVPCDFARYTSYGIRHVVQASNFEVIEIKKSTTYFLAIAQMLIAYLAHYILPRSPALRRLLQIIVIFPINLMSLTINALLPKRL